MTPRIKTLLLVALLLPHLAVAGRGPMKAEEHGSSHWAKFVGEPAEKVCEDIRKENPELNSVVPLHQFSPATMDFRQDRVRVFHDDEGRVVRPPKIG